MQGGEVTDVEKRDAEKAAACKAAEIAEANPEGTAVVYGQCAEKEQGCKDGAEGGEVTSADFGCVESADGDGDKAPANGCKKYEQETFA